MFVFVTTISESKPMDQTEDCADLTDAAPQKELWEDLVSEEVTHNKEDVSVALLASFQLMIEENAETLLAQETKSR